MKGSVLRRFADSLTLTRSVIAIPLIISLISNRQGFAWILLLIAGLTDIADGWLARRAGGGSVWGAKLDPLSDKILLMAPILWLVQKDVLPILAVWLLLTREFLVSNWRTNAQSGGPASANGKIKTILLFISILFLLWPNTWGWTNFSENLHQLGWWLFWPALLMALISGFNYFKDSSIQDQQ